MWNVLLFFIWLNYWWVNFKENVIMRKFWEKGKNKFLMEKYILIIIDVVVSVLNFIFYVFLF